ncbi:unnamed protein product [Ectocarpus sp. CCAP 1310/34]|nr:unnamed protein product [Ectocarpus sp. CCAP 1310/34]
MVDEVVVMIIVIYVDCILVAGSDEDYEELLASLNENFPTKNLGECQWSDGYAIERDVEAGTLRISQTAYIDSMVKLFDVQSTSRISATPGAGLATTVGGTVVSHGSKTQSIVSLSSTEAEYIAAGEGVKEALFVRAVLSFVAPETSGSSIQVLEDNQGAIALVQNPLSSGRTKHIDVRYHFIRGLFGSGDIAVKFVPTKEQHADLLTKALSRASLQYHRRKLINFPEKL